MANKETSFENNLSTTIPVHISYPVLENALRKKLVGEEISKVDKNGKESKYAEILNIFLKKSELGDFDITISINLRTLTVLYNSKDLLIHVHASLQFDYEKQKISVNEFEVDSQADNWLADKLLESVVNKFMYDKLKQKLNFDFMPQINEQLNSLNIKLENRLEATDGIHISGALTDLKISNLETRESGLWMFIFVDGWGVVEIENIVV